MDLPPCDCAEEPRLPAEIRTSFTDRNLGRRFLGCSKWDPEQEDGGTAHCGYFRWYDRHVELPGHIRALIIGLKADNRNLRRNGERMRLENGRLRAQLSSYKSKCWSISKFVLVIVVFLVIVCACSSTGDVSPVLKLN